MRSSRIFVFARTMRWASVAGFVRNARAISSVVRPQTSRSVSAHRASGASAGWQHVKIRRSRSSSTSSSSGPGSPRVGASNRSAIAAIEASNRARRRSASIAWNRPADTSHALGLVGTPSRGQHSSAAAKASCSASSARSKSPRRRISVARMRRESERQTASTASRIRPAGSSATGGYWWQPAEMGRTSTAQPPSSPRRAAGCIDATRIASFKSLASMMRTLPTCSFVST